MIKVYEPTEKIFNHNGLKILHPKKCDVFKEDNGDYYIEIEDNLDNLEFYQSGMIITCDTPFPEGRQAFRISNSEKASNKISVKAKHVYFDSANYIIEDNYIVDKNCNYALNYLNDNCDTITPFTFSSDITRNSSYRCIRKSLEEAISVVRERWSGHLVRNNFSISINETIGQDRGVVISYLKNLTDIKATEDWSQVCTKILPIGKDGLKLPETYLSISETIYEIPYTKVVSFTQELDSENYETEEEYNNALIEDLRSQATLYLEENKYPKVNYSLNAHLDLITDVGDTIKVIHPRLKIEILTNVISIKWDAISKKYKNIEFGNFKNSLKNLINDISSSVSGSVKQDIIDVSNSLNQKLIEATGDIWSMLGNSYVIYEGDKILIVDKIPKEEATNVMMINSGGIGFSNSGINGVFTSAWTLDGTLDMQNINVINLTADLVKSGTLKVGGENNSNGTIEVYDSNNNIIASLDKNGFLFGSLEDYNTLINKTGTYYREGETVFSKTTKDSTITKDMVLYGKYYYGVDENLDVSNFIKDDAMFVAEKYTDGNGEEGFGHFWNSGG